ncbi:MAG: PAS domain-containing protein [Candidatus Pacebacteria bacterium]|nr:PAS domain-containing protein [Candidatus Paceibacterota bacterium]
MENINFRKEQFDLAVLGGTATWWQMHLPSGAVSFGDAKAAMLGYPEEKFMRYQDFVDLVHPDDREKTMQAMRNHLDGKAELYETTYRIRNKNGEYISFYDCGQITKKEGDDITVTGFVRKIDESSDTLAQMKEFKEMILEGNPSIVELVSEIQHES